MAAGNFDLEIEQGATYYRILVIKDKNHNPQDISGCVFRGQIRRDADDTKVLAEFSFNILNQTEHKGMVEMLLTEAQTRALPAARQNRARKRVRQLCYDIEFVDISGAVNRVIEGVVFLSPEVTR